MILILIGIIIALYSFVNYKKAFIWFFAYQIFVQFGIQLFNIGNLSLPLSLAVSLIFLLQFIQKKKYKNTRMKEFPFKLAFILILLSRFMTCFTAAGSFTEEINRAITFSFQNIINIYIAWYVFSSKKEFRYFYKVVTIIFFFACILGYYEYFAQYNPYTNYEKNFIGEGINYYSLESVRGFRITSVFEHPIGAGMNFGMYFVGTLYLIINEGKKVPMRRLALVTAFLCVPLVLLTKQRSAMIFTIFIALILINFRKKRFYGMLMIILIGLFAISPMLENYSQYLSSIFDQDAQSQVKGSSMLMRLMQLEASFELLNLSPLFGLGVKYSDYISNIWTKNALMLESVWLDQMVKHGILGLCSYLSLVYEYVVKIPKKYNFGKLVFLPIGFWIIYSITTIPSFRMHLLYVFLFYLIYTKKSLDKIYEGE